MEKRDKIGQDQIYDLITGENVSWQNIIFDLINTEQLDPWDVNLVLLTNKYLEKIRELEEANFFVSGKVLLAASLLLRIKAEILLEKEIRSLDEILFGKKDEEEREVERIEIDPSELPRLYPKTPLPRLKKVSLQELMTALSKAISTENKRIRREVIQRKIQKETEIVLPARTRVNIKDRIKSVYDKIIGMISGKSKVKYFDIAGDEREEKIACFLPVLHLDSQKKIFLEQEAHFNDVWIWLFRHYKSTNPDIEIAEEDKSALADFFNLLKS